MCEVEYRSFGRAQSSDSEHHGMYVCMYVLYVCMYCMYVCRYVCMYVCMYVEYVHYYLRSVYK